MKNILLRAMVWLFGRKQKKGGAEERFLIISTTGVGDTLWGTPALRALRQAHPENFIAVLTTSLGKEILEGNPHLSELFELKKPFLFSFFRLYFQLKKRCITTIFLFHASQRIVLLLSFLIGAAKVAGIAGRNKGLDSLFTHLLEKRELHEIEQRLHLVGNVACKHKEMEIPLPQERELEAATLLKEIPSHVPIIGLHPGAKDRFKRWPMDRFIETGRQLCRDLGCQIIVTGSDEEQEDVRYVAAAIEGAIPLTKKFHLQSLAALIKKMTLFILNDTGPMHIACAVQTPVVALFSPTDPHLCGPYFVPKARVLAKPPTCRPCLKKRCAEPFCLFQITPTEVVQAALSLLR